MWSGSVDFDGITADDPPTSLVTRPFVGASGPPSDPIAAEPPPANGSGTERKRAAADADLDGDMIVFDPPMVDFGRVLVGSVVSQVVWIINGSDFPVIVMETKSTCGCTVARMTEWTIAAGDGIPTRIELVVPRRASTIQKQVRFRFGDGQPDRVLTVKAHAVQPVVLSPEYLRADNLGITRVVVESTDSQPFRILGATPSILTDPDGSNASILHEVGIDRLLWYATGQPDRIDLQLDHPEASSVSLSVRVSSLRSGHRSIDQPSSHARVKIIPPPRLMLSTDRLRFGKVSEEAPSQLELAILGSFAPDTQPDLRMDSGLADLMLVSIEHTADGLTLSLQLTPRPDQAGYLRSELAVRIGAARAWCDVFAAVNLTTRD